MPWHGTTIDSNEVTATWVSNSPPPTPPASSTPSLTLTATPSVHQGTSNPSALSVTESNVPSDDTIYIVQTETSLGATPVNSFEGATTTLGSSPSTSADPAVVGTSATVHDPNNVPEFLVYYEAYAVSPTGAMISSNVADVEMCVLSFGQRISGKD